uniref:Uncharacterized protein n=1 Tax=Anguilla anguilla TaxID=7936 RepID=A0A0E9PH00_ANGAN
MTRSLEDLDSCCPKNSHHYEEPPQTAAQQKHLEILFTRKVWICQ